MLAESAWRAHWREPKTDKDRARGYRALKSMFFN